MKANSSLTTSTPRPLVKAVNMNGSSKMIRSTMNSVLKEFTTSSARTAMRREGWKQETSRMTTGQSRPRGKDEADIAAEQEDFARQEALWKAKHAGRLQARGICYNCGESTHQLFCDVHCRQDYEKEKAVKAKQTGQGAGRKERPQ